MKKLFAGAIIAGTCLSISTVAWGSIFYSQNTGFDSTTILSTDTVFDPPPPPSSTLRGDGDQTNDINWETVAGLASPITGLNVVDPVGGNRINTMTWNTPNNSNGNAPSATDWGEDAEASGLRLLGFSGQAEVGTPTTISRIFHQNNEISGRVETLLSATITSILTIGSFVDDENAIAFEFDETSNLTNLEDCDFQSGDPCPDKFTFPQAPFGNIEFTLDEVDYVASFAFGNLNGSNVELDVDGDGNPIFNIWTDEFTTSSADVVMTIDFAPVPEPATMLLFGTGLAGLAGVARRRMKK